MNNEQIKEGYKLTEVGVIPDDWEVKKLSDITDIDIDNLSSSTASDYFFKYISLEEIDQGFLRGYSEQKFISSPSRARRKLRYGDVLLATVRPNLKSHFLFKFNEDNWVCSTGFSVLRYKEKLSNYSYIYFHLFSSIINKQIEALLTGSNYPAISSKNVRELLIPLPPIAEQEKIAEVLTDIDDLIEGLGAIVSKKRLIKQGAMQELLTGKRRLQDFGENKGYKQTELGLIPEDWEVKKLHELAEIITGSTPPTNDSSNYGDKFLFVSPVDMGKSKYIKSTEKKLSSKGFYISRKFPFNTILFVCIGSTIGKCAIASEEMTANQQINGILPSLNFISEYLYYLLLLIAPKIKLLAGEQAVPIVNKTQFGETFIYLPPTKEEQEAIAQILTDMDKEIEKLEEKLEKYKQIKQGMMQELLTGNIRL